ncbi:MAG TPA: HAD family hydrolase, partial [Chryseosolibacter sp.]|nr:HAD family hydrolase [Chryseosolibacter sp.]
VTGESKPVKVMQSELVYAGGRLIGVPVKLVVEKKTSQSHLTSLWNNDAFKKIDESKFQKIIDRAARRFTWVVLVIAVITAIYWQYTNTSQMWLVLTSVLMVACPCALALAAPFTFGSMLRVFGKNRLYLKNADVIERMAGIDAVVFDKTGTVTHGNQPSVRITGSLSHAQLTAVKTLTGYSTHPLSKVITKSIAHSRAMSVSEFKEIPGKGIEAVCDGNHYRIGSAAFTSAADVRDEGGKVFVAVNGEPLAHFSIRTAVRSNLSEMMQRLGKKCVALLSGDHEADRSEMQRCFRHTPNSYFNRRLRKN